MAGARGRPVGLRGTADPPVAVHDARPQGNVTGDWAGWGAPAVERGNAAAYRHVVRGEPWQGEWVAAGVTAKSFVDAGESARNAEQYNSALAWYGWAMRLDAGLRDPWYLTGLIYDGCKQWQQALDAYNHASAADRSAGMRNGNLYYRMGMIYFWRLETHRVDAALEAFRNAIDTDDFSANWMAADSHYRLRGMILRQYRGRP